MSLDAPSLSTPLGEVRSLCPECLREAPGGYFAVGGRVELRRRCPEHGLTRSHFWSDVRHWRWVMGVELRAEEEGAGLCCAPGTPGCGEDPAARRCVTVLPMTDGCNLTCPYCFAGSTPGQAHRSLEELETMLVGVREEAGGPTPLQLSGGEPTVHPDLPAVVRRAQELGFRHIWVNTNGLRLAREEGYAATLRGAGVDAVYLQFDGLRDDAYLATRGEPLVAAKRQAVEVCRRVGLPVVLVPTIVRGRNDDQLGPIVRYALANADAVRGVNLQPVRHFGRYAEDTGHLSPGDVASLLADQLDFLEVRDLFPIPCCSAACFLAAALLPADGGAVPLNRFVRDEDVLGFLEHVGERRYVEFLAGAPDAARDLEEALCACGIPAAGLTALAERVVMLSVTGFMDAETVDLDRMERCCIRVATRRGRLAPFCGYYLTDASGRYAWREAHFPEDEGLPHPPRAGEAP